MRKQLIIKLLFAVGATVLIVAAYKAWRTVDLVNEVKSATKIHVQARMIDFKLLERLQKQRTGPISYSEVLRAGKNITESDKILRLAESFSNAERRFCFPWDLPRTYVYYVINITKNNKNIKIRLYGDTESESVQAIVFPGSFWQQEYRVTGDVIVVIEEFLSGSQ